MIKENLSAEPSTEAGNIAKRVLAAGTLRSLLDAGILRPFPYTDGGLKRYSAIKKEDRVVIRLYNHMGDLWCEKSWFTNFGRKSSKPFKVFMPELNRYSGHHWSIPSESYEFLVKACH